MPQKKNRNRPVCNDNPAKIRPIIDNFRENIQEIQQRLACTDSNGGMFVLFWLVSLIGGGYQTDTDRKIRNMATLHMETCEDCSKLFHLVQNSMKLFKVASAGVRVRYLESL